MIITCTNASKIGATLKGKDLLPGGANSLLIMKTCLFKNTEKFTIKK